MLIAKLAYYEKRDWKRFLKSIDDSHRMHDTWEEWHKEYNKAKKNLRSEGFVVTEIVVDIDELQNYCKVRGIKNNGKARSGFVVDK